jgi:predicted CXXCH cytochrome family protein
MKEPNLPNTKDRAKRIDPTYVRRAQPWRRTRRWLVLAFCIAVLIWLGLSSFQRAPDGGFRFTAMAHNPGHLAAAHAMIEHDCLTCHAGDGRGGFIKTVSDSACLKCHDAGIHSVNQTTLMAKVMPVVAAPADADAADVPTLPIDNYPGGLRSADCVHCHTEHQGEAALRATDNSYCIECHINLKDHFGKLPSDDKGQTVANHVSAFDGEGNHPHFGLNPDPASDLMLVEAKLVDRTRLKFNHAVHNNVAGLTNNCTSCHTPITPNPRATANPPAGDPRLAPTDRPLSAAAQTDPGDMQPITFERNCIQCHKLELANGVSVSHRDMAVVRGELAAIPALIVSQNKLSADDLSDTSVTPAAAWKAKIDAIVGKCANMDAPADAAAAADSDLANATTANTRTYFKQKAAALRYLNWLTQAKRDDGIPLIATTQQSFGTDAYTTPDPTAAEIFIAYVGTPTGKSCNYCHVMNGGDVPVGFQYKLTLASASAGPATTAPIPAATPDAAVPTTLPTTQPSLLDILPTGIPSAPRRWFASSHFDHAAHRDLSCFNCHANAPTSTDTADLMLPDLDSSNLLHSAAERKAQGIKSCIDCHGPPASSSELSAPSNCITCHVYHDRTKEDSLDASAREKHHPSTMPAM